MSSVSELTDAMISNRKDEFDRIIDSGGFDLNEIDDYGFPPIIEAAIVNNNYFAQRLIDRGALVNKQDATGRTALHWACDNNNSKLADTLLSRGSDPNIPMSSGQSALVFPLLRRQEKLKNMLYRHGADLKFAQNYINTKLLGHRFELKGQVHTPNNKRDLILIDYEGFFLEFSVAIIFDSLRRFRNNFAARHLSGFFPKVRMIVKAIQNGEELIRYQHYMLNLSKHKNRIMKLIHHEPLFLPVTYRGHAISFIKYGNILIKCDRGANSKREGAVVIYKMEYPQQFTHEFIFFLIYQQHNEKFIHYEINELLGLKKIDEIPLSSQISGNCSWANVEAAVPSLMFILLLKDTKLGLTPDEIKAQTMSFYHQWKEWDKDRSIDLLLKAFREGDKRTQASLASIVGAIFFQTCRFEDADSVARAERMIPIMKRTEFQYVYRSYLNIYYADDAQMTQKLNHLLDIVDEKKRL